MVKLVALTQPRICLDDRPGERTRSFCSPEEFIAFAARVSNPGNQFNFDTAPKLIRYLLEHRHWSPFEQVSATLEIKTTRDISAQIIRHRSFSYQEFSQRYATVTSVAPPRMRRQAAINRQSSTEHTNPDIEVQGIELPAEVAVQMSVELARETYEALIAAGVARETARAVLPLCTETTLYMTGSLRSWIHYTQLRTQQDTQAEHREIALQCKELLASEFPWTFEALEPS